MLAARHRLGSGTDFSRTIRRGRKAGTPTIVVHLLTPADPDAPVGDPPRVGFVVGRAVGNAVARNSVKRRLRHLCRARVDLLPAGSILVVRALPGAAAASSTELGSHLDRALARLLPVSGTRP